MSNPISVPWWLLLTLWGATRIVISRNFMSQPTKRVFRRNVIAEVLRLFKFENMHFWHSVFAQKNKDVQVPITSIRTVRPLYKPKPHTFGMLSSEISSSRFQRASLRSQTIKGGFAEIVPFKTHNFEQRCQNEDYITFLCASQPCSSP